LQSDTGQQWLAVPFALWSLQQFKASRMLDLEGVVTLRLDTHLAGEVSNETQHPLEECLLEKGNLRCELGPLAPGAHLPVRGADWKRRDRPDAAGNAGLPAQTAASTDELFHALRDEVSLMTAIHSAGTGEEVVLTARLPDLPPAVQVAGL